ncbi:MAG: HTH-type transcriptional regulator BenM [Pseudomonadota bacterium]|jgi:DNA-binding transcriptional LysR family regulator
MDLRHLRCFVQLAEDLHFGRAAKKLAMSQPPLTVAIQQLEESVGARLFVRSSRSVALTAAGEALLPRARVLLSEFQAAIELAQDVGQGRAGRLRVGMVGTMLFCGLPTMVKSFETRHPGVRLTLTEMSSAAQLAAVQAGELDVGLVHATQAPSHVQSQRVFTQSLWGCLASDHPLAQADAIDLRDMLEQALVLVSREVSPDYHDALISACTAAGWRPKSVHGLQHWLSVVAMVAQGSGIGLAPQALTRAGLPNVTMLPVRQPLPRYDTYAVWRGGQDHATLQAFVQALEAELGSQL